MPIARLAQGLEMHYVVDDYTDPWKLSEAILLLHGNNESSPVWFGWVPHLARHFRVVRPDMRLRSIDSHAEGFSVDAGRDRG